MTDKPDLTKVWAENADPTDIKNPDTDEAGKFQLGWLTEVPPHTWFNYIQNNFSAALAHFNEYGVAQWDADTVYPIGGWSRSIVDGEVYVALSAQSGNEPSASPVQWKAFSELFGITRPQEIELKSGRKNLIINGDFGISQRGSNFNAGVSVGNTYCIDRMVYSDGTTLGQVDHIDSTLTSEPTTKAIRKTVTGASSDDVAVGQFIEKSNAIQLVGKSLTLSFWRKSDTGTFDVFLIWRDTPNSTANEVWVSVEAVTQTTTDHEYHKLTVDNVPAPVASNTTLCLFITNGSTTTGQIEFNLLQLEKGTYATDFEYRPIAEELALCKRYYEVGVIGRHSSDVTSGFGYEVRKVFGVEKRVAPTIALTPSSASGFPNVPGVTLSNVWEVVETREANATQPAGIHVSTYTADAEL